MVNCPTRKELETRECSKEELQAAIIHLVNENAERKDRFNNWLYHGQGYVQ